MRPTLDFFHSIASTYTYLSVSRVGDIAARASTDEARRLGIFGSPTFVCGEELFWGDDRFDDAIEWAKGEIRQPA